MKKTLQKELKYQMLPNEKQTQNEPSTESQQAKSLNNSITSTTSLSPKSSSSSISNTQQTSSTNVLAKKISNPTPNFNIKKNLTSADMSGLHEDVNFKYLKHVVLKFLTSREYEVK